MPSPAPVDTSPGRAGLAAMPLSDVLDQLVGPRWLRWRKISYPTASTHLSFSLASHIGPSFFIVLLFSSVDFLLFSCLSISRNLFRSCGFTVLLSELTPVLHLISTHHPDLIPVIDSV